LNDPGRDLGPLGVDEHPGKNGGARLGDRYARGDWGEAIECGGLALLGASVEADVTVSDTADVHGDGRSEQLIGRSSATTRSSTGR
jgi:aryl-alcohol dehydrogenase-like predicted oxidoreductase